MKSSRYPSLSPLLQEGAAPPEQKPPPAPAQHTVPLTADESLFKEKERKPLSALHKRLAAAGLGLIIILAGVILSVKLRGDIDKMRTFLQNWQSEPVRMAKITAIAIPVAVLLTLFQQRTKKNDPLLNWIRRRTRKTPGTNRNGDDSHGKNSDENTPRGNGRR